MYPGQESLLEAEAPLERVGFYMQTCFLWSFPETVAIAFC